MALRSLRMLQHLLQGPEVPLARRAAVGVASVRQEGRQPNDQEGDDGPQDVLVELWQPFVVAAEGQDQRVAMLHRHAPQLRRSLRRRC